MIVSEQEFQINQETELKTLTKTLESQSQRGYKINLFFHKLLGLQKHKAPSKQIQTNLFSPTQSQSQLLFSQKNNNDSQKQNNLTTRQKEQGQQQPLILLKQANFKNQLKNSQFYLELKKCNTEKEYQILFQQIYQKLQENKQSKLNIFLCIQCLCLQAQFFRKKMQLLDSIKCLEKCLRLFEISDLDIQGKIYFELGDLTYFTLQFNKSAEYFKQALILYEQVNWYLDIAKALVKLAKVLAHLRLFDDAKKLCYEALIIYKNKKNDNGICKVYETLGIIFFQKKDYIIAISFLEQSLDGYKQLYGDRSLLLIEIYNYIGMAYHFYGEIRKASEIYELAVWTYRGQRHYSLGQILNNLGLTYIEQGKYLSAQFAFKKAHYINPTYRVEQNRMLLEDIR